MSSRSSALPIASALTGLSMLFLFSLPSSAAEHTVQVGPGLSFSPSNLTIEQGDTVTWTNAGGFHNVEANDGSFRCAEGCDGDGGNGDPSSSGWSASVVFDTVGTVDYFCVVHRGAGMTGRIVVQEGGDEEPGTLRFSTGATTVNENAGNVRLTVQRIGGDDGAASVSYATSNGSAQAGQDFTGSTGTLNWADNDDDPKSFDVPILDDSDPENNETFNVILSNATGASLGNPGNATVTIRDNDEVQQNEGVLAFSQDSYQVSEADASAEISVERSGGSDGAVSVQVATADGSATAGADYSAVDSTLSWADGDSAAKTFSVPVLEDLLPEVNETINLTLSSPTGGATLGTPGSATLTVVDNDTDFGPCVEGPETLCLGEDDRFKVEVFWRTRDGESGLGQAVTIGRRDSGLFYFFNENNIELLVKVLDACALQFESYFVFFAATTNVEFTLTVIDTEADVLKQYFNPLGMAADPIQDTRAFETCP